MCFVEPVVRLYAIHYSNMYVYSLFAKIILLDTIYLLKFFAKLFLQHNSYPEGHLHTCCLIGLLAANTRIT